MKLTAHRIADIRTRAKEARDTKPAGHPGLTTCECDREFLLSLLDGAEQASVIDAAPDLLAALEAVVTHAKSAPFNPIGHALEHTAMGHRVYAAIAKAKGQ